MKTEFTEAEVDMYLKNLSPAEKALITTDLAMTIDFSLDMHFDEYDSISLIELITLISQELLNYTEEIKGA